MHMNYLLTVTVTVLASPFTFTICICIRTYKINFFSLALNFLLCYYLSRMFNASCLSIADTSSAGFQKTFLLNTVEIRSLMHSFRLQ